MSKFNDILKEAEAELFKPANPVKRRDELIKKMKEKIGVPKPGDFVLDINNLEYEVIKLDTDTFGNATVVLDGTMLHKLTEPFSITLDDFYENVQAIHRK